VRERLAAPALLALLGLLTSARLAADHRQAYLDGVAALRRGRAEDAVRLLAQAVSERPDEQARARLVGVIPEPYLPHHYLGVAYAALDRCADALREWERSAEQGVVATFPELTREASQGAAECRRRLGVPSSEERAAEAAREARAALLQGVQAHLDGDYRRAVRLLDALSPSPDPRFRALHLTVRAAARHALYRLGGERDAPLLAAALVDVRDARRSDPAFRPSAAVFPPSFLQLYDQP
jgi:hypothetical protein